MSGPIILGVILAFVLILFASAFHSRHRLETRVRVLEVLARAIRGRRPLPPLLARIATESRGGTRSALDRAAKQLDSGHSLAEALEEAGRVFLPSRDTAAIHAVEDTKALPDVLDDLAAESSRTMTIRHRVVVGFIYPIALLPLLLFTYSRLEALAWMPGWWSLPSLDLSFFGEYLPFIGIAMLGFAVLLLSPAFRELRPWRWTFMGKAKAKTRLLRLTAILVRAGRPLPDALRRAAEGAGRRAVARAGTRAAARVEAGETLDEALAWCSVSGADIPARLIRQAELRTVKQREKTERRLALLHPVTVLIFATLVFLEFRLLFDLVARHRESVMPW